MGIGVAPVDPADFVVLRIGIVVAALRIADLVAGKQHRDALREHQRRNEVALLLLAQREDALVLGGTLGAAVPRAVVVVAVAVVLAIGLVVLVVVGNEVLEREAVMGGDEVDARPGPAPALVEEVARGGETGCEARQETLGAHPEFAHHVAIVAVPFREAGREIAELVAAWTHVPRLGDQLQLAEQRVLQDGVEEGVARIETARLAAERQREIEAEAVDAIDAGPQAEAVHHHLQHARMVGVDGVARAGQVVIVAFVVRHQPVIGEIVDALEGERRPEMVALGGMVVDDVEDDLDARLMQPVDRLGDLREPATVDIVRLGREEADRIVAPEVPEPALLQMAVLHEGMHRHQFDRRNADPVQVFDRLGMAERREGAADIVGQHRVAHRPAADMRFIDHRLRPGGHRPLRLGEDVGTDDARLGHEGGAVALVLPEIRIVAASDRIAVERIVPGEGADEFTRIGVEQQLRIVEAVTVHRVERAADAIAVELAGLHARDMAVPDAVGAFGQRDALGLLAAVLGEEAERDAFGMVGKQREIGALGVRRGAEGIGIPRGKLGHLAAALRSESVLISLGRRVTPEKPRSGGRSIGSPVMREKSSS